MKNRQIKYRGKTQLDNWVKGSLLIIDYHNSLDYIENTQIVLPNGHTFDVIPESVGQFTGLKDKTGEDIYEGDIVSATYEWESYYPDSEDYVTKSTVNKGEVIFDNGEWRVKGQIQSLYKWDKKTLEVIGDIFSNPEMLSNESKVTFKIKIVKSSDPFYWYADKIGQIFESDFHNDSDYHVDKIGFIQMSDAELVDNEN